MDLTALPFFPYRSKEKYDKHGLIYDYDNPPTIPTIKNKEVRLTTLHHVHGPNTWMIDYFFLPTEGGHQLIMCCFIHCNTRYVDFAIMPDKSAGPFLLAVQEMKFRYPGLDTLIGDSEKAFHAGVINNFFYLPRNVNLIYYGMELKNTDGQRDVYHLKLAIIDRFARTLRDMIFNSKRSYPSFELNPTTLRQIVDIYNNTPHHTLSKIMKFDVTPRQAFEHEDLQNEIVRRVLAENYNTTSRYEFEEIQRGDLVYLHKPRVFGEKRRANVEDNPYRVIECRRGGYILADLHGRVLQERVNIGGEFVQRPRIVPRSEITHQ